jgi:hypothetical protein
MTSDRAKCAALIVISSLEEGYSVIDNSVDDTMLSGQATRPRSCKIVFQRLGLADSREKVANYRLYQLKRSQRN